ncbi:MAG: FAD-dependent oxidoreductase [Rhodospirillales bacterium]
MNVHYDGVIIGGGHNGLVCAAYLARSGQRVLVLEAAEQLGGMAATREFAPGFHVSACAHLLHMLPRSIVDELALTRHGLEFAAQSMNSRHNRCRQRRSPTTVRICSCRKAVSPAWVVAMPPPIRH